MGDENVPPERLSAMGSLRKMSKPLMERRRRQRINDCLDQLKSILETLTHKQSSYLCKLEKADILEMTVHCVKNLRQRQSAGETDRCYNAAQYVEGFDACTREVGDCLQSQNFTVSPELYAGLLNHLATYRRRLLLARSHDRQRVAVLPPAECPRLCSDSQDENANCLQTAKVVRQIRAVAGDDNRSPLLSIANKQFGTRSAAEASTKTKPVIESNRLPNAEHTQSMEQTSPSADVSIQSDAGIQNESCMSRDAVDGAVYDCVLSLETENDVTSPMWRPW